MIDMYKGNHANQCKEDIINLIERLLKEAKIEAYEEAAYIANNYFEKAEHTDSIQSKEIICGQRPDSPDS